MGFNLADAFAGAAQGFGSGMAQIGKMGMEQEAQRTTEEAKADLMLKREKAMAQFNNDLQAPDKQRDYDLRAKVADAQIADHSMRNELTGKMNESRAGYLAAKAEADALRAEAAKTKADAAGTGGAGKPLKLDQTLSDNEKLSISRFDEALKEAGKARASMPGEMGEKAYAQQVREAKISHAQEMAQMGAATINPTKDGVVVRTKSGQSVLFKSLDELRAGGFDNPAAEEHFASIAKKAPTPPSPSATTTQPDPNKLGGLPSPSKFNLMEKPKSEEEQRAQRMAVAFRYVGMPIDKLQEIMKTAKDPDQKAAAQWALSDAMSRGSNMDFAYGGM